jgi:capsular exopolysaccharide synthesis family protein
MSEPLFSFEERRGVVRYVQAFRQHWWLIFLLVILATGGAAVYSQTAAKRYKASADILVDPFESSDSLFRGFHVLRQPLDGSSPVVTAIRVLRSHENFRATEQRLDPRCRGASLSIDPLTQADIVSVTGTSSEPNCAALAANTFARVAIGERTASFQKELTARIRQLRERADAIPVTDRQANFEYATLKQNIANLEGYRGSSDPTLRILTEAVPPESPVWPRPVLSVVVALIASLLLGGGLAVAFDLVNPRVSREEELKLVHRLPILARIPRLYRGIAHGYLSGEASLPSGAWKGYRTLRAVLASAGNDGGFPKSIMVTSASPGDGKTMTAVNLAITLASADMRVILVDGDFHRPMIGSIFNVTARRDGFLRLLSGRDEKTAVVSSPNDPRLRLVLSNREQAHHVHLLDTERFSEFLRKVGQQCDIVVIDSPPLPEVAEALAMAGAVDAVLISVRLGHTRREKLAQLRELLARRGVSPLGFVLTTRERSRGQDEAYDYDYSREISTVPAQMEESGVPKRRVMRLTDR